MIEVRELRYGNLITYKGDVIPVTMIGRHGIQSKTEDWLINAKFATPDLEPIQLTDEWFLRMGFEKEGVQWWDKDGGTSFEDCGKGVFRTYTNGCHVVLICFVHQLQNLYFALTGNELTIKAL